MTQKKKGFSYGFLADLLHLDYDTGGCPALPPESREEVVAALRQLLVDREALNEHIRELQAYFLKGKASGKIPEWHHRGSLPLEREELVFSQGAGALEDTELAALILNPTALFALHEQLLERFPEAWWEDFVQDGRRLTEPPGAQRLSLEELIERAGVEAGQLEEDEESTALAGALSGEQRPVWTWNVGPADPGCTWGESRRPEGLEASRVQASWASRSLEVRVHDGFLDYGPGCTLEVRWESVDGSLRAQPARCDRRDLIWLDSLDRQPPRPDDVLRLKHTKDDTGGRVWEVSVSLRFADGRTDTVE